MLERTLQEEVRPSHAEAARLLYEVPQPRLLAAAPGAQGSAVA
jgi:hypothetical protein